MADERTNAQIGIDTYKGPRMPTNLNAMVKATIVGVVNTFVWRTETTDDLPPDAIGECVTMVVQQAWRAGEDPTKCVVIVQFEKN